MLITKKPYLSIGHFSRATFVSLVTPLTGNNWNPPLKYCKRSQNKQNLFCHCKIIKAHKESNSKPLSEIRKLCYRAISYKYFLRTNIKLYLFIIFYLFTINYLKQK